MRGRLVVPLCWALTSCVVGGFSIRDELPGAGGSDIGGSSDGGATGARAGASNGGSATQTGGTAPGGNGNQAGSTTLGGQGAGGDPTVPEGGGGAGGDGDEGPKAVPACAKDELARPPIFCDDFEKVGQLDAQKWEPLPGIAPRNDSGPHGPTGLIQLDNTRLKAQAAVDLELAAAGAGGTTVSFWAKTASGDEDVMWAAFGTATNPDVRLNEDQKGLFWRSVQNVRAPGFSNGSPILPGKWICVSIYLTTKGMTVSYVGADTTTATTFVVDEQPTPGVDTEWLNQSPEIRTIATFIGIGPDPLAPAALYFDDLRIAHGKSNVCGL